MAYSNKTESTKLVSAFRFAPKSKREATKPKDAKGRPNARISRLMALAIRFEELLRSNEAADYSELANRYGVDRGRISRIMHLRLLAPDLQTRLLTMDCPGNISLKVLLPACKLTDWRDQRAYVGELFGECDQQANRAVPFALSDNLKNPTTPW